MGRTKKPLPEFLHGVCPEPKERAEYQDAMSNLVRLVEYLRINDDILISYDYQVMLVVELERDRPRADILRRVYGKMSRCRRAHEESMLWEWVT